MTRMTTKKETRGALFKEAIGLNKPALFEALDRANVSIVTVTFDGGLDYGQIEWTRAFNAAGIEIDLPKEPMTTHVVANDFLCLVPKTLPVDVVIEEMAYGILEATHDGWDQDAGAHGEFRFNTAERTISLHFHQRVVTSRCFTHTI